MKKKMTKKEKVLEMNIDELELIRSFLQLSETCRHQYSRRALTNRTPEDMMKVRNLGRKSLEEVLGKTERVRFTAKSERRVIHPGKS